MKLNKTWVPFIAATILLVLFFELSIFLTRVFESPIPLEVIFYVAFFCTWLVLYEICKVIVEEIRK